MSTDADTPPRRLPPEALAGIIAAHERQGARERIPCALCTVLGHIAALEGAVRAVLADGGVFAGDVVEAIGHVVRDRARYSRELQACQPALAVADLALAVRAAEDRVQQHHDDCGLCALPEPVAECPILDGLCGTVERLAAEYEAALGRWSIQCRSAERQHMPPGAGP